MITRARTAYPNTLSIPAYECRESPHIRSDFGDVFICRRVAVQRHECEVGEGFEWGEVGDEVVV
jgi:ssRNA-specific RNase YbeY (16S rRNA maturation enzyme)